jgi:hypothetical protein
MVTETNELIQTKRSPLVVVSNAAIHAEKSRVMLQVRLNHLALRGRTCAVTQNMLQEALRYENYADTTLKELLVAHPAYPWFSQVPGVGAGETIGKVLGELEAFGHYYDIGDPMIPFFVDRDPEEYIVLDEDRNPFTREGIWVEAIERWQTPSAMRKYGGITPDSKRERGEKLTFNADLRTFWFRLVTNMNRTQSKQPNKYHEFYTEYKEYRTGRFKKDGVKILPTPKSRLCPSCEKEMRVPRDTMFCPDCGTRLAKKDEPEGVVWQGHLHMMCLRREIQLFSDHLWVVWREALGLPVRTPYPMEKLGHTSVITPWDMVAKPIE